MRKLAENNEQLNKEIAEMKREARKRQLNLYY